MTPTSWTPRPEGPLNPGTNLCVPRAHSARLVLNAQSKITEIAHHGCQSSACSCKHTDNCAAHSERPGLPSYQPSTTFDTSTFSHHGHALPLALVKSEEIRNLTSLFFLPSPSLFISSQCLIKKHGETEHQPQNPHAGAGKRVILSEKWSLAVLLYIYIAFSFQTLQSVSKSERTVTAGMDGGTTGIRQIHINNLANITGRQNVFLKA